MNQYKVEYLPMDIEFVLKTEEPCTKEQICMFVDFLVAKRPTKNEALLNTPHFFNCEVIDIAGYVKPELDDDLVYVEKL